jgi:D-3-phosphoglycerate dehydrogenase
MKALLTDTKYPDPDGVERPLLEEAGFEVEVAQCHTAEEVIRAGRGASALVTQYAPITREVLTALPEVCIVTRGGVGVDTINLQAAAELGVWVANVPDYGMREVATHALGMALALIRHLPFLDRDIRAGGWHFQATGTLRRPSTLTLGIVGYGRIGSTMAQLAVPCFQRVIACDPYLPASAWPGNVQPVDHDTLFSQSDVVSLHVPLTDETRHMADRRRLMQMPDGGYLVNTSRGAVVNVPDLLEALDSGKLAGAALDVLPEEPPPRDHAVLQHPRLMLTPHAAFYSLEAEAELRRKNALNIVAWAREGRPPYVVVEGRPH